MVRTVLEGHVAASNATCVGIVNGEDMDFGQRERQAAASVPPGSVVAVLVEQHTQIRDLFAQVGASQGAARKKAFDLLRELLAIHEVGEEIVVHPTARRVEREAAARKAEEKEAASVMAGLEKMDVDDTEFAEKFIALERRVSEHALRAGLRGR
jgi:hypothetical protein